MHKEEQQKWSSCQAPYSTVTLRRAIFHTNKPMTELSAASSVQKLGEAEDQIDQNDLNAVLHNPITLSEHQIIAIPHTCIYATDRRPCHYINRVKNYKPEAENVLISSVDPGWNNSKIKSPN